MDRSIIVASTIAGIIVIGMGFGVLYLLPNYLETSSSHIGSVTFGPQWHYFGNVTLEGKQSSCSQLHLNCTSDSVNQALEYANSATRAYVEIGGIGYGSSYTIVLINNTSYCISPMVSWIQECPSSIGEISLLYVYQSPINSSNPCSSSLGLGQNTTDYSGLISNVENNPKFVTLEGNRTGYVSGGSGCGTSTDTTPGAELTLDFYFTDMAHPFKVCGNSTTYPVYTIQVGIDLTPSGYDLYHSIYSSFYKGPTNTTVFCMTTSSG